MPIGIPEVRSGLTSAESHTATPVTYLWLFGEVGYIAVGGAIPYYGVWLEACYYHFFKYIRVHKLLPASALPSSTVAHHVQPTSQWGNINLILYYMENMSPHLLDDGKLTA